MGIERFIATKYIFRYKNLCTKKKIFGSVGFITMLITISRVLIYFFNELIYVPCIHVWDTQLKKYSVEFRYKKECYEVKVRPFTHSWFVTYEFWLDGAFLQGLPLLALIIITVVNVIALRNQRNDPTLQLPEEVRSERAIRDNQMTKLVLALTLNGVITSFLALAQAFIHLEVNHVDFNKKQCTFYVLYSSICVGFILNPLIYFIFSKTLRGKVKTLLCCMKI